VRAFADLGDDRLVLLTTLTNGLAEEVFFRGALFSASHPDEPSSAVTHLAWSALMLRCLPRLFPDPTKSR
jgi:membrane protease YdiL (CAAX protease family)